MQPEHKLTGLKKKKQKQKQEEEEEEEERKRKKKRRKRKRKKRKKKKHSNPHSYHMQWRGHVSAHMPNISLRYKHITYKNMYTEAPIQTSK